MSEERKQWICSTLDVEGGDIRSRVDWDSERAGTLHGLMRIRGFTQDDSHIYCTKEQMAVEVASLLDFVLSVLRAFGFDDFTFNLSTKDPEKYIGDDDLEGKDDDDGGDFRGKSRSNETHESSTDPDSRLFRKGKTASELRFMGHTLMENRNGLIVNAMVTQADGHAEREAAKAMVADVRQANPEGNITLGADKGYDAAEFIKALQDMKVTPHVAQNKSNRKSAVPDEIASTEGYGISMQKRKLIEQGFGWAKFIGPIRQVMVRGIKKVDQVFMMAMAAYNLVRMRTLGQVRLEVA